MKKKMIKQEKYSCELSGNVIELMSDLSIISKSMKEALKRAGLKESDAKDIIQRSINLGLLNDEELEKESDEALKKFNKMVSSTFAKAILGL